MSDFVPDAYCGLYCASCGQYQKTLSGELSLDDPMSCMGCKSKKVSASWCAECHLKSCAREKGVEFCYQCAEFPCEEIVKFKDDPLYPYHGEVFEYMEEIKAKGKEAWLESMEKRWNCESCGTRYDWWAQKCGNCGKEVKGYKNPN